MLKEKLSIRGVLSRFIFLFKTLVFVVEKTQEKLLDQISNTLSVSYIELDSMKISALLIFKRRLVGTPVVFFIPDRGRVIEDIMG